MVKCMRGGGKPGVDTGQCPTVGLVAAMFGDVRRTPRQFVECRRGFDNSDRLRQLPAQLMQFIEIKIHCRRGMARQCMPHHVGRHVRIAVAITADPAAQLKVIGGPDSADAAFRQKVFYFPVEARHLAQERVTVVRQAVLDLVVHRQAQFAQDARLPQGEHHAAQRLFVAHQLVGRELDAVALGQQARDFQLAIENALALDLGRMRGQHWRNQRIGEEFRNLIRGDAFLARAAERQRQAAFLWSRPGDEVGAATAVVMLVLGDVGQLREVAERPHHGDGAYRIELVEHRLKLALRIRIAIPPEADRVLSRALDQIEYRLAFLFAQCVAEHAPEQADILPERRFLVGDIPILWSVHMKGSIMVSPRRAYGLEIRRNKQRGALSHQANVAPACERNHFPRQLKALNIISRPRPRHCRAIIVRPIRPLAFCARRRAASIVRA